MKVIIFINTVVTAIVIAKMWCILLLENARGPEDKR